MSMLHFYVNGTKGPLKVADGQGDISKTGEWNATISWGKVNRGSSYLVTQGTIQPPTDRYPCLTGAVKGETAKFAKRSLVVLSSEEHAHARSVSVFQAALAAVQKIVRIEIALEDLKTLKTAKYKLCFAKKVAEGDYNVVWQSSDLYLATNTFSWTPQYQLFGSNTFQSNIQVDVSTNIVDIGLGETSVLDSNGILGEPKTGGDVTCVTLENDYGNIHPGVNQLSTNIDGTQTSTPIYVAPDTMVSGTAQLTPIETVLVWFEQNIQTSTIFSTARSRAVEIDLTKVNAATRKYQGSEWVTP
ncbi:hypothetical protein M0D69_03815 [Caballeronia sp. SEWSISQ10-4 2]|uniref:hypothetical protein n=1 Tax=Caballeronia sp. SEWSISQ10-4 2 TaxID=2937438 RepID=UPI0026555F3B|nr:hypothetical protein [Caballeronia sp. SEWSISQ10-4 2]MDN7177150.1 hypothetical protein [Caballeronia sp. SEWSISQ10-4 2]